MAQDTRSLWEKTVQLPHRAALEGHVNTQVAIIGAGLTGSLLGYRLAQQGVDCVLLEAGTVGGGQSGRTTAKITAQHGMLTQLVKKAGLDRVRGYAAANQQAVAEYASLAAHLDADLGYRPCPSYLYALPSGTDLRREAVLEASLGLHAAFTTATALPFSVQGAVRMDSQAVIHPLALLKAVTAGLKVYEHTPVTKLRGRRLWTPSGTVCAEQVVFACHYPFRNLPGLYFLRQHQARSYVLGLAGAGDLDGSYYGVDAGALSLRPAEGLILAGGSGHRTGSNQQGGRYAALEDQARRLWPQADITCRWSAQDCMTPDGIPYIGPYSPLRPFWYVATGYGKWGMTNAMAAAMILSDAICGKANDYAGVFAPHRWNKATLQGIGTQTKEAARHLGLQWFQRPQASAEDLAPGRGGLVQLDGRKAGVFRDTAGSIQAIRPRCPHMGCQLAWNPDEQTWDCPCHGSRFDAQGRRLNGPAQDDAEQRV